MLRAGLIRRLASGLYTWMPLGLRVLRKVEAIVREEMNRAGALELVDAGRAARRAVAGDRPLGAVRPGAAAHQGPPRARVLLRPDRRGSGQRHRAARDQELPPAAACNLYQIQTKFRDEIRPRFGVMRAREFMMKDAYSFHADYDEPASATYRDMYDAYTRIFTRLGLQFRAVAADTGAIGGTGSHEFQVLADSGEDAIAYSPGVGLRGQRGARRSARARRAAEAAPASRCRRSPRPGKKTCEDVCRVPQDPARADGEVRVLRWTATTDGAAGPAAGARRPQAERGQGRQARPGCEPFRFATEAEIRATLQAPRRLARPGRPAGRDGRRRPQPSRR